MLHFKHADDACSWPSRMWVAAVPCYLFNLLTTAVLCSAACEWLLCLVAFKPVDDACLWLQSVSGCYALLHFKLADNAYLWFCRM